MTNPEQRWCCEDWRENNPKINDAFVSYAFRNNNNGYDGKPFRVCPWCAEPRSVEKDELDEILHEYDSGILTPLGLENRKKALLAWRDAEVKRLAADAKVFDYGLKSGRDLNNQVGDLCNKVIAKDSEIKVHKTTIERLEKEIADLNLAIKKDRESRGKEDVTGKPEKQEFWKVLLDESDRRPLASSQQEYWSKVAQGALNWFKELLPKQQTKYNDPHWREGWNAYRDEALRRLGE